MSEYYFGEYVHYYLHYPLEYDGSVKARDFFEQWEKYFIMKLPSGYAILSSQVIDRPPESKENPIGTLGIKIRVRLPDNQMLDPYLMKHDLERIY